MPNVVRGRFSMRHVRTSADSGKGIGLKNASIGTSLPESSLSRLARPRDASLRPAKILRRCHSEQPTALAMAATVIPLAPAQRSMGCESDMDATISTRNIKSQPQIFPSEMPLSSRDLVKFGMGTRTPPEPREIFLSEWLKLGGIGPSEAATVAGCTQGYISSICANTKQNINVLYLLKLSERLEITINDFYRKPLSHAQVAQLEQFSPQARAFLISRKRKKA